MRKTIVLVLIIILAIPEIIFASSVKIASLGGTGMMFPEQNLSINLNPASVQLMQGNILSLTSGCKGKENYFLQLDLPGRINEKSGFNFSFEINDRFKKTGVSAGANILAFFDFGVTVNYIIYEDTFNGLAYNIGFSKKFPRSFFGVSLINAGDTVLAKYRDSEISDFELLSS
ncbi:MAG: hypothetical protein PHV06_06035, partial [bacterium]|nr:hypothetical protein [bacterium]